jgi:hypothetical protein
MFSKLIATTEKEIRISMSDNNWKSAWKVYTVKLRKKRI